MPGDFFRRALQGSNRIRESRAVHLQKHLPFFGERRDRVDLIAGVDRPQLGRLGDADHARFVGMQFGLARDYRFDFFEIDLAGGSSNQQQFGTAGEKFRRAAFVGLDVRLLVTNHAVKRLAKLGQGKGVGRGAVEDQIGLAISLEEVSNRFAQTPHPFIVTIRFGSAMIGLVQSG